MSTFSTPTAVKYGRRSPKRAPALRLGPLLTGSIPSAPTAVDYGTLFTGWQVLGNDTAGDCVAVTWANQRALVSTALAGRTSYPNQNEVWSLYRTQNPNFDPNGTSTTEGPGSSADNGMDIQTALEYLVHTGGPDGVKAVAFASVDYTNEAELRAAHAIFGQVWYGVTVLKPNLDEFWAGQEWQYNSSWPVDGGHSITGVGYNPTEYSFVTWGRETAWSEAFRSHQVEEAWVVIWPEHLGNREFETGIDLGQLAVDYHQLTGRPLAVSAWQGWSPVLAGTFDQGAHVTAVSRKTDQIDVFAVGQDGGMYTAWWNPAGGWGGWSRIGSGAFNQGTPVAVVSRNPEQLDLFAVGQDGGMYTAWWNPAGGWGGWARVLSGEFNQGTPVAAVSRKTDQIDVFAVGQDGGMYTAWWNPAGGWGGWSRIGSGAFNQGTPIAAVSRNPDQLDLFAVGQDGGMYTAWWNPAGGWGGWARVPSGTFNQGTPVAAISRKTDQIDVFAVGQNGGMYTAWWNPAGGWGGWSRVRSGTFKQGTPVAVASRRADELDLFGIGQDGGMYTAWWTSAGGWGGWAAVRAGKFNQDTPVAAVSRNPGQLDVFAVGLDGHVSTAWWGPLPS